MPASELTVGRLPIRGTISPLKKSILEVWVPLLACPAVVFGNVTHALLGKPAVAPLFNRLPYRRASRQRSRAVAGEPPIGDVASRPKRSGGRWPIRRAGHAGGPGFAPGKKPPPSAVPE